MPGPGVIETVGAQFVQRRRGGGADKTVEQHWYFLTARGQSRAQNGREFASPQRRREAERIAEGIGVTGERRVHQFAFANESLVIQASAAPDPKQCAAAK